MAQKLRRATAETAAEARDGFLDFWNPGGREHFREEEELLLPVLARHVPPDHEDVVRVLTDHVDLRRRAADLTGDAAPALESLHDLGRRLDAHIRHEERVLFPLAERVLSEDELEAVGEALA